MVENPKIIEASQFVDYISSSLSLNPNEVRRLVIDALAGEPIKIYVEMFGTERMLKVSPPDFSRASIVFLK